MEDPNVEQKAEQLARLAADRAASLALLDADKATALAVTRAVKDANFDHDLAEHSRHLLEINGSQNEMALSLGRLVKEFEKQTVANEAIAQVVVRNQGFSLNRRTQILTLFGVIAAYSGIIFAIFHP